MRAACLLVLSLAAGGALAQAKAPEKYENPVDGRTYTAPGGWQTYKPQSGTAAPVGKVRLAGVRLLSAQSEFASNVSVETLSAYVKQVQKEAAETFASANDGSVMVQFESGPQGQEVKLAYQGHIDQKLLQQFHERLKRMERLQVRNSPVAFQVQLAITP